MGGYLAYRGADTGAAAPNVGYTLLDGSTATTNQLRGKVVLVNFWATDCAPCVREMPQLAATHEKFKARGYDTLAVAMSYDPPALVIAFAERRKLPFGVVIDNTGAVAKSFDAVKVTPTSVLINRQGEIVKRFVGEVDMPTLHALVEKLLAES
ncbi:MAG: TlpA disulfide reductase family protein [Burkholderiales bacterium]